MATSVSSTVDERTVVTTSSVAGLMTSWLTAPPRCARPRERGSCTSWFARSQALETPVACPVGNRGIEGGQLHVGGIDVVVHHVVAERGAGEVALGKQVTRLAQRVRHPRGVRDVRVAGERLRQRQLLLDAG